MSAETSETIADLYDSLARQPGSILILEQIAQIQEAEGWTDSALETANGIQTLDPSNPVAKRILTSTTSRPKPALSTRIPRSRAVFPVHGNPADIPAKVDLVKDFLDLRSDAGYLAAEIEALVDDESDAESLKSKSDMITGLKLIMEGKVANALKGGQFSSAREVAAAIMSDIGHSRDILVQDFLAVAAWNEAQRSPPGNDTIRERLIRRKVLLQASLPETLGSEVATALTYVETRCLNKTYVNSETMIGQEPIEDIPAEFFFTTEDNYAWDITELVQALEANDGVMRNPLSKAMFTERDIRNILARPQGAKLQRLNEGQKNMRNGVSVETRRRVGILGALMHGDQSPDGAPSRVAVDEFLNYLAAVPEAEQRVIQRLKIPATDSTSRQPFDYTIGQAVGDAKANVTCFHKVGDFLSQAANYLAN